ncbi:hypothetical protein [Paenibacillus sp. R14(2021)]|uniref:hypothetical protein n=1 Tax=Paenibacillus sp. R14(2021) TaxID=2859228 RepID=UPI001C6120F6|nr:hypothetical protein [Paenibacillus sp. R14(2021)]
MPRRMSLLSIIILVLVVIGLVSQTISNPYQLLIPVGVFAVIYLLYKFPPGNAVKAKPKPKYKAGARKDQQQASSRNKTRKNMPFRVIEGGKDDDNLPKYH